MVKAYCDASEVFANSTDWLELANRTMELLLAKCRKPDGGLWHSYKAGKATINGYLEDYSFTTEALLALYAITFEERWLTEAKALAEHAIRHFHDRGRSRVPFHQRPGPALDRAPERGERQRDPGLQQQHGQGLFLLGHLFDDERYLTLSDRMLKA